MLRVAELDLIRMTTVGVFAIGAECSDFDRVPFRPHQHYAKRLSDESRVVKDLFHIIRPRTGRDVVIARRQTE